jgi:hypothetical protein
MLDKTKYPQPVSILKTVLRIRIVEKARIEATVDTAIIPHMLRSIKK